MPHVKIRYAKHAGIIDAADEWTAELDAAFDLRIAGVNHFTWMLRGAFAGRDVSAQIADSLRQDPAYQGMDGDKGAKALHNNAIAWQLYEIFSYVPVCVSHTKEYLRFYQGHGVLPDAIPPLKIWETETRYARHEAMWRGVDDYVSGVKPMGDFMTAYGPDHATDVIENMVGGLGRPFYINTQNRGAVGNMADDAFLELLCDLDMDGPQPRPVGDMPRGLRGLQEIVLDTHELTAEAIVKADYRLLRRALMTDPLDQFNRRCRRHPGRAAGRPAAMPCPIIGTWTAARRLSSAEASRSLLNESRHRQRPAT